MAAPMSPVSSRLRSTVVIPSLTRSRSTSVSSRASSEDHEWMRQSEPVPRNRTYHRSTSRPLLRTAFRDFTSMATVVVGEKGSKSRPETTYLIHKELLTSASPFFAAALNGTFAEGLDQRVYLHEEKPDIFEWFLQWLYTGTLTTQPTFAEPRHPLSRSSSSGPTSPTSNHHSSTHQTQLLDGDLRNPAGSPKYFLLLDLFALSDRLLTTPLSNHILSTIARLSEATNSVPTPSDTWILYDRELLRDPSPVRALVLDLFAYKKTDRLLETHRDEWHPKFLRDLVVKLKRPGPEALERHSLVAWRPSITGGNGGGGGNGYQQQQQVRACENCRELIRAGVGASDRCCVCDKHFCGECLRRHAVDAGFQWQHDSTGCKPWSGRGMCLRYHEHARGEACG